MTARKPSSLGEAVQERYDRPEREKYERAATKAVEDAIDAAFDRAEGASK
jgi:hypothetical protein